MLRPLCIFFAAVAIAEEPFRFETTPGRLPKDVVPAHYSVRVEADADLAGFRGSVTIEVDARKAVSTMVLNSLGLKIDGAQVDGNPVTAKADDATQLLSLSGAEWRPGKHTVTVSYHGKLSERQEGLYLTKYQLPGGEWRKALVTQMEATDARRMFPCWDEPVFRATFALTAVVPGAHTAISNMPATAERMLPDGRKECSFAPTPPMPSYLVALASAELEKIEDEVDGVKLRIFTTPGKTGKARFAMDATKKVLPYFNEYFGVKYPLPKLDQISFPSVAAGGMENWGCIIYQDTALLHEDGAGSQSGKERVFGIVAHEIAHQWFGDLVTMAWWDNLWLNEGFASWMATKASDHFNPSWKLWLRSATAKEAAMRLDARATTHPIQQPVKTEAEARHAFDEITYKKGQAFLRMLESWLGESKFRDGMRRYMARHANGNTTTADLWKALGEAAGVDVAAMAGGWTEQPGFPLVEVRAASGGRAILRQRRFVIHQENAAPLQWRIPVQVLPIGAEEPRVAMLAGAEIALDDLPPLVANAGRAGYFRVQYSDDAWEQLKLAFPRMTEADRLAMLQDTWALVQAGRVPFARWIEAASMLQNDPSPVIGVHFLAVFGELDFLARGTDARVVLRDWARGFLAQRWRRAGWDAKPGEEAAAVILRAGLIRTLGSFGEMDVVGEALKRTERFLREPASLGGEIRSAVLSVAGRHASPGLWDQLHELAKKTPDAELKEQLYNALASSRESALAERALAISLTGELQSRLAARMVERVAEEGEHVESALKFARAHLPELLALLSVQAANRYVPTLYRGFTDASRADELVEFAKANLPPEAGRATAIVEDEIRFNAQFKAVILPGIRMLKRNAPAPE